MSATLRQGRISGRIGVAYHGHTERFCSLVLARIIGVCDNYRAAHTDAEIQTSQQHSGCPHRRSCSEDNAQPVCPNGSGDSPRNQHRQAELGLVDSIIAGGHRSGQHIAEIPSEYGPKGRSDQRRYTDQYSYRSCVQVIGAGPEYLVGHGALDDDPAESHRPHCARPDNDRVEEKFEWRQKNGDKMCGSLVRVFWYADQSPPCRYRGLESPGGVFVLVHDSSIWRISRLGQRHFEIDVLFSHGCI